jgi:hypothetical protein
VHERHQVVDGPARRALDGGGVGRQVGAFEDDLLDVRVALDEAARSVDGFGLGLMFIERWQVVEQCALQ